jgi:hypothetical protein
MPLDSRQKPRRPPNKEAAQKSFRKPLKGLTYVPRVLIMDKRKSHGAAQRDTLPGVAHRQHRYLNNRAENSRQPTRQRARRVQGFKPAGPRRVWSHFPRCPPTTAALVGCSLPAREAVQIRHLVGPHNPAHRSTRVQTGGHHAPSCLMIMSACNKLTYMDPPPVSRDGRAATRKRADAGIYPASD